MSTIILLNKPFQVLSQFSDNDGRQTLAKFIQIPKVYPAGRLDYDSEGLLLLTDDGVLQNQIANPKHKLPKTYWVQVEGAPNSQAVEELIKGVTLKDGKTLPAEVKLIEEPELWERNPPVRFRQSIPTHWLSITIREGRNRQVRRMTAAVGLPTLRLIRAKIGSWELDNLQPGEHKSLNIQMPKTTTNNTMANNSVAKKTRKVVSRPSYRTKSTQKTNRADDKQDINGDRKKSGEVKTYNTKTQKQTPKKGPSTKKSKKTASTNRSQTRTKR